MFVNISANPLYRTTATAALLRHGGKAPGENSSPSDKHIRIPPAVARSGEAGFVSPPSERQALMRQREAAARVGLSVRRGCCAGRRLRG